jgi:hypothetical protein
MEMALPADAAAGAARRRCATRRSPVQRHAGLLGDPRRRSEAAGVWRGVRLPDRRQDVRPRTASTSASASATVEEWTIVRPAHVDDHVFHIHTNPFQVVKVNGVAMPGLPWRDTVVVPRLGSVVFRSRFLDYTGLFMLHCHMMNHEELGMMQTVEIYEG